MPVPTFGGPPARLGAPADLARKVVGRRKAMRKGGFSAPIVGNMPYATPDTVATAPYLPTPVVPIAPPIAPGGWTSDDYAALAEARRKAQTGRG